MPATNAQQGQPDGTPAADLMIEELADGGIRVIDPNDPELPVGAEGEGPDAALPGTSEPESGGGEAPPTEGVDALAERAELAAAATEDERQVIRERRRQERADKKRVAREREDNLRRELSIRDQQLDELRGQIAHQQRRFMQSDAAQIDAGLQRAQEAAAYFKSIISEATKKQDGAAVAEATEAMMRARDEAQRLTQLKQSFAAQQAAPPPLDPGLKSNAEKWLSRHAWYSSDSNDVEAQLVRTLDASVANDRFDPRSEAYWNELDRRIAQYMPHRAGKTGYTPRESARGKPATPVAGSGREGGGGSAQGAAPGAPGAGYTLSAERVRALKDAGFWDDPKSRADMIRRYRETDRAAAARRS